ncbi:MAG: tRNA (mo5U34)-methyltransferase [bacterium ADurb.Bin157]|nr:MAG: tRNA (mo5U34)-methyltransferase [bacterium ADurb.Bin157]
MRDFSNFYNYLDKCEMKEWIQPLRYAIESALNKPDGNLQHWETALKELPEIDQCYLLKNKDAITVTTEVQLPAETVALLKNALLKLRPWRKGPFELPGCFIDSEWRSDIKWRRVAQHISPLKDKKILDVGCGNGYYLFRMAEQKPAIAIGVDPSSLFLAQFEAINKYGKCENAFLLPIGFEALPENMKTFDTVFSMGVFYHRRAPFDFLKTLKMLLNEGGELILETLIIDGDENTVLVPPDRYAGMKNVWFIPSARAMVNWLKKSGFKDIKCVDLHKTEISEQRATEWMPGESLADRLDKRDCSLTCEGLPAPVRAVFVCSN